VADTGRTWLVRRAERLYGDRLGRLRHSELSWHIAWKWLPVLVAVGFIYGIIAEFTGNSSSLRAPGLFSDVPLFVTSSILTGLVLWSLTLFWSFRRLLVFDRGLLYGYAQKQTARAIFWNDIDATSLRTVQAPAGVEVDGLLKTLDKKSKVTLGVSGRFAVVFRGVPSAIGAGGSTGQGPAAGAPQPGFFTFSMSRIPDRLVAEIEQAMAESGLQPAGSTVPRALPPVQISSAVRLDQA
jgi:hypothetical protein